MALPIISADERLAQRKGIKGCIFGRSGIGKTSLLWTLNTSTTLFMDLEAGDLAVEGWDGDTLRPRTWKECRDFAVFIGGPNPALREDQPYSEAHFDEVCGRFGAPAVVVACDMPRLGVATVTSLIAGLDGHDAAMARSDGPEPMCAIWSQRSVAPLRAQFLAGERAMHRAIVDLDIAWIAVPLADLRNINTPGDLGTL